MQKASRLRLLSRVLNTLEVDPSGAIATVSMNLEDLQISGADSDDTEGFVNYPLSIQGIEACALFREVGERSFRVSLRSKQKIDVSRVAVETVRIGDLTGVLYLDTGQEISFFSMNSKDLVFKSDLILKENSLTADVKEFSSKQFNSRGGGQVRLSGGDSSMLQEVVILPFHLVDSMTGSGEKRQDEKSKSTTGKINELEPFHEE